MTSLHLICRSGLHLLPTKFPVFESGFWDLSADDAKRLVGGSLFLHETKSRPSYFGGTVLSWRVTEANEPYPGRIVFEVCSTASGKGAKWKGAAHAMAWSGGIVSD